VPEAHECVCENEVFELMSGVSVYEGTHDVRWYYIACRCVECNLVAVFADWKCEAGDAAAFFAKEFLVPFKADHVTLELRPKQGDKKGELAFVRYTASCPLCAGLVLLHDGGDEFKDRIVGRCDNSPREHVYSFDQKLHVGHSMRGH